MPRIGVRTFGLGSSLFAPGMSVDEVRQRAVSAVAAWDEVFEGAAEMTTPSVAILSDIDCHLGEGPTYDPVSGKLFWFDIRGRKLLEKPMPDGVVVVHDLPEMTSALAVIDDDRQLLVTETGLYIRDVRSGCHRASSPAGSRQFPHPLQRFTRPSVRSVLDRHDGQERGT